MAPETGKNGIPHISVTETVKALSSSQVPPVETRWQIQRQVPLVGIIAILTQAFVVISFVLNLQRDVQENTNQIARLNLRFDVFEKNRVDDRIRAEPLIERFYKNESTTIELQHQFDQLEGRVQRNEEFRRQNDKK